MLLIGFIAATGSNPQSFAVPRRPLPSPTLKCLTLQGPPSATKTAVLSFPGRVWTAFCRPVRSRALGSPPVGPYGGPGPLRTLLKLRECLARPSFWFEIWSWRFEIWFFKPKLWWANIMICSWDMPKTFWFHPHVKYDIITNSNYIYCLGTYHHN